MVEGLRKCYLGDDTRGLLLLGGGDSRAGTRSQRFRRADLCGGGNGACGAFAPDEDYCLYAQVEVRVLMTVRRSWVDCVVVVLSLVS